MHGTTTQYLAVVTGLPDRSRERRPFIIRDRFLCCAFEPVPPSGVDDYGIEYSEMEVETTQGLEAPRVRMSLANEIAEGVNPLENDEYFGINCYKKCVRLFRESGHS